MIHFATYYNFRKILTHITVNYGEEDKCLNLGNRKEGYVLSSLPHFKRLTHLKFVENANDDEDVTDYDLSVICPKLQSLEYCTDYAYDYNHRLKAVLIGLREEKSLRKIINEDISELDIHLPNLSSNYIDLITTKFSPTQLKKLSITLDDIDMYD